MTRFYTHAILLLAVMLTACGGNPNRPDPIDPTPTPTPTPRADQMVFEAQERVEPADNVVLGIRAPATGMYIIELTYAPGNPDGRADLFLRADGFPIRNVAEITGEEQPKRIEMRFQQNEWIKAGAFCVRGPVTVHLKYFLKGE